MGDLQAAALERVGELERENAELRIATDRRSSVLAQSRRFIDSYLERSASLLGDLPGASDPGDENNDDDPGAFPPSAFSVEEGGVDDAEFAAEAADPPADARPPGGVPPAPESGEAGPAPGGGLGGGGGPPTPWASGESPGVGDGTPPQGGGGGPLASASGPSPAAPSPGSPPPVLPLVVTS